MTEYKGLSPEELADRLNDHYVPVAKEYIQEGHTHVPTFIIHDGLSDGLIVGTGTFRTYAEKESMLAGVKKVLEENESQFYYTIIEAWYVDYPTPEELHILPSQSPRRKEALVTSFFHRNGFTKNWTYPFNRTEEGVVFDEPMVTTEGIESRFKLFDEEELSEEV